MKKNIAKLKRKADLCWSEKIRSIGHCEVCGATEHLQSHHFLTRRNTNLRWKLENGVCVCPSCHLFSNDSFHHNPIKAVEFLTSKRPQDFIFLKGYTSKPIQLSVEDMEGIIMALQKEHIVWT